MRTSFRFEFRKLKIIKRFLLEKKKKVYLSETRLLGQFCLSKEPDEFKSFHF